MGFPKSYPSYFFTIQKEYKGHMPLKIEIRKSQFYYIVEILSLERVLKQD